MSQTRSTQFTYLKQSQIVCSCDVHTNPNSFFQLVDVDPPEFIVAAQTQTDDGHVCLKLACQECALWRADLSDPVFDNLKVVADRYQERLALLPRRLRRLMTSVLKKIFCSFKPNFLVPDDSNVSFSDVFSDVFMNPGREMSAFMWSLFSMTDNIVALIDPSRMEVFDPETCQRQSVNFFWAHEVKNVFHRVMKMTVTELAALAAILSGVAAGLTGNSMGFVAAGAGVLAYISTSGLPSPFDLTWAAKRAITKLFTPRQILRFLLFLVMIVTAFQVGGRIWSSIASVFRTPVIEQHAGSTETWVGIAIAVLATWLSGYYPHNLVTSFLRHASLVGVTAAALTSITDIFTFALEMIAKFVTWLGFGGQAESLMNIVNQRNLEQIIRRGGPVEQLTPRLNAFLAARSVGATGPGTNAYIDQGRDLVVELDKVIHDALGLEGSGPLVTTLRSQRQLVVAAVENSLFSTEMSTERIEPVFFTFCGVPRIGKTLFVTTLIEALRVHMATRTQADGLIRHTANLASEGRWFYSRNTGDAFFSGYNRQAVIFYDDIFTANNARSQDTASQRQELEISEVQALVSSQPYAPSMPEIGPGVPCPKGTYISPAWVIATSNYLFPRTEGRPTTVIDDRITRAVLVLNRPGVPRDATFSHLVFLVSNCPLSQIRQGQQTHGWVEPYSDERQIPGTLDDFHRWPLRQYFNEVRLHQLVEMLVEQHEKKIEELHIRRRGVDTILQRLSVDPATARLQASCRSLCENLDLEPPVNFRGCLFSGGLLRVFRSCVRRGTNESLQFDPEGAIQICLEDGLLRLGTVAHARPCDCTGGHSLITLCPHFRDLRLNFRFSFSARSLCRRPATYHLFANGEVSAIGPLPTGMAPLEQFSRDIHNIRPDIHIPTVLPENLTDYIPLDNNFKGGYVLGLDNGGNAYGFGVMTRRATFAMVCGPGGVLRRIERNNCLYPRPPQPHSGRPGAQSQGNSKRHKTATSKSGIDGRKTDRKEKQLTKRSRNATHHNPGLAQAVLQDKMKPKTAASEGDVPVVAGAERVAFKLRTNTFGTEVAPRTEESTEQGYSAPSSATAEPSSVAPDVSYESRSLVEDTLPLAICCGTAERNYLDYLTNELEGILALGPRADDLQANEISFVYHRLDNLLDRNIRSLPRLTTNAWSIVRDVLSLSQARCPPKLQVDERAWVNNLLRDLNEPNVARLHAFAVANIDSIRWLAFSSRTENGFRYRAGIFAAWNLLVNNLAGDIRVVFSNPRTGEESPLPEPLLTRVFVYFAGVRRTVDISERPCSALQIFEPHELAALGPRAASVLAFVNVFAHRQNLLDRLRDAGQALMSFLASHWKALLVTTSVLAGVLAIANFQGIVSKLFTRPTLEQHSSAHSPNALHSPWPECYLSLYTTIEHPGSRYGCGLCQAVANPNMLQHSDWDTAKMQAIIRRYNAEIPYPDNQAYLKAFYVANCGFIEALQAQTFEQCKAKLLQMRRDRIIPRTNSGISRHFFVAISYPCITVRDQAIKAMTAQQQTIAALLGNNLDKCQPKYRLPYKLPSTCDIVATKMTYCTYTPGTCQCNQQHSAEDVTYRITGVDRKLAMFSTGCGTLMSGDSVIGHGFSLGPTAILAPKHVLDALVPAPETRIHWRGSTRWSDVVSPSAIYPMAQTDIAVLIVHSCEFPTRPFSEMLVRYELRPGTKVSVLTTRQDGSYDLQTAHIVGHPPASFKFDHRKFLLIDRYLNNGDSGSLVVHGTGVVGFYCGRYGDYGYVAVWDVDTARFVGRFNKGEFDSRSVLSLEPHSGFAVIDRYDTSQFDSSPPTELRKSALYDPLERLGHASTKRPAKLTVTAMEKSFSKWEPIEDSFDATYDEAAEELGHWLGAHMRFKFGNPKPFSCLDAVLNGHEAGEQPVVKRVDMRTSAGAPWCDLGVTKKDLIDDSNPEWMVARPLLVEAFNKIETRFLTGDMAGCVTTANNKDELREHERVDACKTRLFCAPPLHYNLLLRKYLGRWIGYFKKMKVEETFHAMGTDVYGQDWNVLYGYLCSCSVGRKVGRVKILAGDFSRFDTSHSTWRLRGAFKTVGACCQDADLVRRLGHTMERFSTRFQGREFRVPSGLPSGGQLTTPLNCVLNVLLWLTAWKRLTGTGISEFAKHTRLVVYGDDVVLAMYDGDPYFSFYTPKAIVNIMRDLGYVLEGDDGGDLQWKDLSEATFLKRRFVEDPEMAYVVHAPRPLADVWTQLMWTRTDLGFEEQVSAFQCFGMELGQFDNQTISSALKQLEDAISLCPKHVKDAYVHANVCRYALMAHRKQLALSHLARLRQLFWRLF